MKKVLSLATIIVMLLVLLTGCVNVNYEVTLNKDGTADVAYVYGFEKEFLKEMETTAEDMTNDMKESAETSDYTIEAYSDDKIEGFKAKKHVENLSEISLSEAFGEENVKVSEGNEIKIEKKGSKTVYSQNAEFDLSGIDESMASMVTMKYTINLPTKVGNNNASEVSNDGKTLTWNLKAGETNKIEFEAIESGSIVKMIVVALIAIIGVAIIVAVVMLIVKKSKKERNTEIEADVVVEDKTNEEENTIENEEKNNEENNKE